MPRIPIARIDDPRLSIYRDLKRTNATRNARRFVVEGDKLVDRLLASRFPTTSVLVSDRFEPLIAPRLPADLPIFVLPESLVDQLVGFNVHKGVLAEGERIAWPSIDELAANFGQVATVVVAPRIDNPENLGAIARIADVFGVDALIVGGRCPDPLSRRVLRVSMGTSLNLPILAPEDLLAEIGRLKSLHHFECVATALDPPFEPLDAFQRRPRTALFLGNEGNGLENEWFDLCDRRVTIPMRAGAESLNVAVASGILLYHFSRSSPS